jgi:hypothetical protein
VPNRGLKLGSLLQHEMLADVRSGLKADLKPRRFDVRSVATNTSVSALGSVGLLIYGERFPHCPFPNAPPVALYMEDTHRSG